MLTETQLQTVSEKISLSDFVCEVRDGTAEISIWYLEKAIEAALDIEWLEYMDFMPAFEACLLEGETFTFYGAPKEDFFEYEGWAEAKAAQSTYILMENLS